MKISLLLSFILLALNSFSQTPTLGLLHISEEVSEGYTLFTPEKNENVYLINNCGETINTWTFSERPGLTCYLLENGNLLRTGKDSLEIRDWNNNLIWSYDMAGNGLNQHHDVEPLPNGNILCVVSEIYTDVEMLAHGRDASITGPTFKLDKIVEISPLGTNDATIVWEWKFIDHFIQDFDNTKANFGVVEDHPELIDINYDNGKLTDWTHVNAIDYNADLDQILLSTRHLSEIHIIDHSTTTVEAAGHVGGDSNKGGDFLWRWGNPIVYRQGTVNDQQLFLQHDAKWVDNGFTDEGKISVFNNGGDIDNTHSSIHLIQPTEINGVYSMTNSAFLPLAFDWSWTGTILNEPFFESKKCGVIALKNGNLIFCETSKGQFTEITKQGQIVWVYKNPTGPAIYDQFTTIINVNNSIFRAEKYLSDYAGFDGVDLTPQSIIENTNTVSDDCIQGVNIEDNTSNANTITCITTIDKILFSKVIDEISIYNITGKLVAQNLNLNSDVYNMHLNPGLYIIEVKSEDGDLKKEKIIIR